MSLNDTTRELIAPLVAVLKALEIELARVEATLALAALAERDRYRTVCHGTRRRFDCRGNIVLVIDEAKRFGNAHAVGAYLGLVPTEATTRVPDKRRLGSITKQGNTTERAMLVQSAWLILRSRDVDDPLGRWADKNSRKRGKRIAIVALDRKLAGVLWAMCRDGTVYDRAIQANQSAIGVRREARKQAHRADVSTTSSSHR